MNCRSIHLSLNPFKHNNFFTTECILGLCRTLRINNGYSAKQHSFIVEILRAFYEVSAQFANICYTKSTSKNVKKEAYSLDRDKHAKDSVMS